MGDSYLPSIKLNGDCIPDFLFIKFVHAEDVPKILSGNLRMGSAEDFTKNYKGETGLRNDPDDCLSAAYKADKNIVINLKHGDHVAGQCEINSVLKDRLCLKHPSYLFCMSAITGELFSQGNSWHFDSRVKGLGDKAIIFKNSCEFLHRINNAIQSEGFLQAYPNTGGKCSGFVRYEDFDLYNGSIGPFVKSKTHDFQKEYRLAVIDSRNDIDNYPDALFLEVGDLTDIVALVVDTDELIQQGLQREQL
ncbi:MAG: hypothetical protein NTV00_04375 [Methylococcales bacterium]|nr:hypothetical protein [Methylococcales bacterium]